MLTERKTRYEIVRVLESKTAREVLRVLHTLRHDLGKDFGKIFRAITCDNGCEFSAAKEMEQLTPIYYCHPYSCWERGTNENQNKLIRRFCRKGKSMATLTDDHAEYITLWMNNYPRRLLGWAAPRRPHGRRVRPRWAQKCLPDFVTFRLTICSNFPPCGESPL